MLSKPKFITPNLNSDVRVVDNSSGSFPVSFIVDGNESINGVRIEVSNPNSSSYLYNSSYHWVASNGEYREGWSNHNVNFVDGVFNPVNEYGENNLYSVVIGTHVSGVNQSPNRPTPYRLKIYLQKWSLSAENKYVVETQVESQDVLFYCNKKPNINITYKIGDGYSTLENDISIDSRAIEFKGMYSQEENVPLKKYGWRITDKQTGNILHDTISKSQIYGTKDNMICRYNGFVSDCEYKIELFVETQNGDTKLIERNFKIKYVAKWLTNDFKINALRNEPGIKLDWSESVAIMGSKTDGIYYKNNFPIVGKSTSVVISKDESVTFERGTINNLDISDKSYIVLSMQIKTSPTMNTCVLFYAEGYSDSGNKISRKLDCNFDQSDKTKATLSYRIQTEDGEIYSTDYILKNYPGDYVWYIIKLYPFLEGDTATNIEVSEFVAEGGVIPSDNLYPREDLYPSFGEWTQKVKNNELVANVVKETVDESEV